LTAILKFKIRRNQGGFRRDGSASPQVLALRGIIEGLEVSEKKASIVFVDFSRAFDGVDRRVMMHVLVNCGIPEGMVSAVSVVCSGPSSFVRGVDGPAGEFLTRSSMIDAGIPLPHVSL